MDRYDYNIRPFLLQSTRIGDDKEKDIIELLHFLEDMGYRGRMQLIEFSILLQMDYDSKELLEITFPYIECKEVEFLDSTIH